MKFALAIFFCVLISFGSGCASPKSGGSSSSSESTAPAEPIGSAASLSGTPGSELEDPTAAPKKPKGPAYLMRMIDYKSGARLELVNESHTEPIKQYSTVRSDPSRKVTSDEWMNGLLGYLRENGWSKEQKSGSAPTMARDSLRWSLEIVGPDGTNYVAEAPDTKGSQRTRLKTLQKAFIDTYNATQSFQAVSAQDGKLPFKVPDYPENKPIKKSGQKSGN